jgi:hypothetical protein
MVVACAVVFARRVSSAISFSAAICSRVEFS